MSLILRPSGQSNNTNAATHDNQSELDSAICRANPDSHLLTALPYCDPPIDPATRARVEQLIADELQRTASQHSIDERLAQHASHLNSLDSSSRVLDLQAEQQFTEQLKNNAPLMYQELQRLNQGLPSDTVRIPELVQQLTPTMTDAQLKHACDTMRAQCTMLEHEQTTLELMRLYGAPQWRAYNATLQHMSSRSEQQCRDLHSETQRVNRQRQTEQRQIRSELMHLDAERRKLAYDVNEIEFASFMMQQEKQQQQQTKNASTSADSPSAAS